MSTSGQWHFYGRPTAFIGRVKELHRLREAMRNAIDQGQRQALLLTGPAGIGKSRLIAEFIESLDQHVDDVTVIAVACRPGGGPPYSIYQRVLRQRFYVDADDPTDVVLEKIRAGIIQVFRDEAEGEQAAHFIGHLVGLRYPRSRHILEVDADPRRIEERATECFVRMMQLDAARKPLLVVVDNLHLADDQSLALLLRISRGIGTAPLLFLAAARDTRREAQRVFAQEVRRIGEVLELHDLPDREARLIVRSLLARAGEVPDAFERLVVERALGNPLSIEQILELQIERGAIEIDGPAWVLHDDRLDARIPSSLRDVVRSKLGRLSPLDRTVLEKAAAVGDVFWSGCVGMLRRADEGHVWDESDRFWTTERRNEELLQVFNGLKRRHIIVRNPRSSVPRSQELAFKHTIEREVLYEGIEGPRRARYHRLIAQWMESQGPELRERFVEQIALHWERGSHPRKAASYYIEAGDRAVERHVNEDAIAFYRKALQCLTDDDSLDRMHVFHKLGRVQMTVGDHAEALGHFQEMLRLAWVLDDEQQGGLAYNKMGRSYRALGEYDLALEHFKNALALFRRVEDLRGIAQSADDIGRVHRMRGDLDLAETRIREGLRLRRYVGDERAEAISLLHLGNVFTLRGAFDEAEKTMHEALELARKADDQKTVADSLSSIGVVRASRGEGERALGLWHESLDISRRLGERQLQGVLLNNMGEVHLHLGRPEEARAHLEQSIRIFEEVGDRRGLSEALRNQGSVYLKLGNHPAALEYAQRSLSEAREVGARRQAGLARLNIAEVHAQTLYDDAPDREARVRAAAEHFEAAIREFDEAGLEADLGNARLAHGAFLAELGREAEAREELDRARSLFVRLDMRDALERTDRILDAL